MLYERVDIIFQGSNHAIKGSVDVDYRSDGEYFEYDTKTTNLISQGQQIRDMIAEDEINIEIINETSFGISKIPSEYLLPMEVSETDLKRRLS